MERIKSLGRYQKGVWLFMAAMVVLFTVLYPVTIARLGFAYRGAVFIPSEENGSTVYSGQIQGKQASFTVCEDKTVYFQYGGETYGPYTAQEDATAVPADSELRDGMTGVELRQGEEILFRGGVAEVGDHLWLYNEDGSVEIGIRVTMGDGTEIDEYGNEIDPMEPSASTILELMGEPELTHKGEWLGWFGGVLICIVTAVLILFAEELFRWNLSFRIRDADQAEASDWEIAGRYVTWTLLPVVAMVIFITGLQ